MKTKIQRFKSTPDFYKFYFPNSLTSFKSSQKEKEELGNAIAFDILNEIREQLKKVKK